MKATGLESCLSWRHCCPNLERAPYKIMFGMIDRREKNANNAKWRSTETWVCLPGSSKTRIKVFVMSRATLKIEPTTHSRHVTGFLGSQQSMGKSESARKWPLTGI